MPFNKRFQKAAYWAYSGLDEYGNPTVVAPIELSVRWEHNVSREITPTTDPKAVDATVWVDREIAVGSMLRKGEVVSIPATPDEIREVVEYIEIPNVRGTKVERVVLVRKFAGTLPTVV